MQRPSGRAVDQLRDISIVRNYTKYAEGSVLVKYGDTHVLCNASVSEGVPRFLKGSDQGWLTAEYSMLPRATSTRSKREASGRDHEIQRLIGRSVRSMVNLHLLKDYTITIDCDVLQADGGTRTASITGASVALIDACNYLQTSNLIAVNPIISKIVAVSVGVYAGQVVLDLDYFEDSQAYTDMNIVMDDKLNFVEVQGTAEMRAFTHNELLTMLELAKKGSKELLEYQSKVLCK